MGNTLFELTGDYLKLLEMAEDETDPQVIEDTLNSINDLIEDKADAYAAVIAQISGEVDTIDAEIKRLTDRKRTKKNNIDHIKQHLFDSMKAMGKTKIKTATHTFGIQKNGGKAPVLLNEWVKVEDLPLELVNRTPNLEKIRKVIEEGDTTWGRLGERGESLRIR